MVVSVSVASAFETLDFQMSAFAEQASLCCEMEAPAAGSARQPAGVGIRFVGG